MAWLNCEVVVSGAAGGIGRAITLAMVARGGRVHALDRDADGLVRLVAEGQGQVVPYAVDLGDTPQVDAVLTRLLAILPGRFDPQSARNSADVISLLRRAGYPYDTPGEFYAAAMRDFSTFLLVGGLLAGALAALNMAVAAPFVALIFAFLGLRRPYVRIKTLAKKRAEAMRSNMLIGLSVLSALFPVA